MWLRSEDRRGRPPFRAARRLSGRANDHILAQPKKQAGAAFYRTTRKRTLAINLSHRAMASSSLRLEATDPA